MRKLLAVLAVVLSTSYAQSQVVFKGPTEGAVNRMNIITLDKVEGDDMRMQAFVNGKTAEPGDWMLMKNIDNQFVIFILTDKQATFTFVAAVNKGSKTYLSSHVITFGTPPQPNPTPPQPNPTPPGPVPPVSDYGAKLKAAYNVSPDAVKLSKLIAVLEEANRYNYKNYAEMELLLQQTAKTNLADSDLRKVRDTIAERLIDIAGDDPRKRDITKAKGVYAETISILKGL